MRGWFKDRGVVRRYLWSYLLIFVFPLLVSTWAYALSYQTVVQQAMSLQLTAQANTVAVMDGGIGQVDEMAIQLLRDDSISALAQVNTQELLVKDVTRLLDAKKKINQYASNHVFKEKYYVFYPENGVVFSNQEITAKYPFWYENFFRLDAFGHEQWLKTLADCPGKTVLPMQDMLLYGKPVRVMPYLVPLIKGIGGNRSVAAFLLEESQLQAILGHKADAPIGDVIMDGQGNVIYASVQASLQELVSRILQSGKSGEAFLYDDAIVVYETSPLNGWIYAARIPMQEALGSVISFRRVLAVLSGVTVVAGLALVWYSMRKTAYPVQAAMDLMRDVQATPAIADHCGPDSLPEGVRTLIVRNETQQQSLERQNDQLRSLYIERVLAGTMSDELEEPTGLSGAFEGFRGPNAQLLALVLQVHGQDGTLLSRINLACAALLPKLCEPGLAYHTHIMKRDEMVVILSSRQGSLTMLHACARQLLDALLSVQELGGALIAGVGSPCAGLYQIRQSYRQAKYALSYRAAQQLGGAVCWAQDVPQNLHRFVFAQCIELALTNAIRTGQGNTVRELLEQIYYENFVANQISAQMQRCLVYNVYCTYIKNAPLAVLEDGHDALGFIWGSEEETQDYAQAFKAMSKVIEEENMAGRKERKENERIAQILAYIHEQYSLWDMDVAHMAGKFGFSENYFSQYFKDQVGERFGEYLEKYRIVQANVHLANPELSIEQIAQKVGYANVYTFRRAFKRVMGVVPTAYREQVLC